ncbi:MAG: response regulator [Butyrivibrio sp.]|nr:response regulator [Butyrivibrio sp.]
MHIKNPTGKPALSISRNVLLPVLIIVIFVAIVLVYYSMLIGEKRDGIIREGEMSARNAETEIDRYMATSVDAVELTAYSVEQMLEEHRSQAEILDYLTRQSTAVINAIYINTAGMYGYIDGEYLDGSGWVPDEDYEPTKRLWYYKTIANNGAVTTIEPYVDALTGEVIMSIAKALQDGSSVVAIDLFLDKIQTIIEENMSSGGSNIQIILDESNMIIAHSDRNEIGKPFGAEKGSLYAAILTALNSANREYYEISHDGSSYIIYKLEMRNGFRCLSIEDATILFRPLELLLAGTLVVVLFIMVVLSAILYRSAQKTMIAERLSAQLYSAVDIYHSVLDVDIQGNTFRNIQTDNPDIAGTLNAGQDNAQETLYTILRQYTDPSSLADILHFVNLSTLNERMWNHRSLTTEFLSTQNHWLRGRFIVSKRSQDGRISRVLWLVGDIDEEKRRRDALLEAVTQMNEQISSVANIYFSMYDVDLAGDILLELRTNAQETSGAADDHMEHAQAVMIAMMDQTVQEQSREAILAFIDLSTLGERMKNTNTITEEFLSTRDIWCRSRFVASKREPDGSLSHVLWLVEGIDEEKRRRDSLIDMSERAIAASEAKSSFLSNMSHEIRTPINAVLGMNEMILRESEDANVLSYSESIRTAGNTLLGIVNDILDFSKIEAGKMEIIPVDYDLSSVLNDLVHMVQTRADDKGLLLKLDFDSETPRLLHGDEVRIKQVITNILTNAIKYTEKGSVTFGVAYERVSDDRILLRVSVRDTGIGIKPEDMKKLFSEFERIEEKRNRNIEGTGLGMNITKRLLEMMGSALKVESVYGEGSVFSFCLEQEVVSWDPLGNYEESYRASLASRKVSEAIFSAPDATVLVVDDTPMNLLVFRSLLKRTGVQIDTGDSGDEGLVLARKKKYDIIFLDHMMPEKDGIETLHELRGEAENPNLDTPTICLTANAISGAREKYLAEGFNDYLTKPIDSAKLEEMLVRYLPEDKIQAAAEETDGDGTSGAGIPENLQPLLAYDWIDVPLGIRNSGDAEAYLPLLRIFHDSLEGKADEVEGYYAAQDWKNYTIKVHALKSSARIIGISGFGEEAQLLENAGKEGDLDYIRAHHDGFMAKLRSFRAPLGEVFVRKDTGDQEEADEARMNAALEGIRSAAEEMDCDRLDEIFEEMAAYRIPADKADLWQQLVEAQDAFDYDAMVTLLSE